MLAVAVPVVLGVSWFTVFVDEMVNVRGVGAKPRKPPPLWRTAMGASTAALFLGVTAALARNQGQSTIEFTSLWVGWSLVLLHIVLFSMLVLWKVKFVGALASMRFETNEDSLRKMEGQLATFNLIAVAITACWFVVVSSYIRGLVV